jgi:hypothetical protein
VTLVLAHAGHWIVETMFLAPVIVVFVFLAVRGFLEARRAGPPVEVADRTAPGDEDVDA